MSSPEKEDTLKPCDIRHLSFLYLFLPRSLMPLVVTLYLPRGTKIISSWHLTYFIFVFFSAPSTLSSMSKRPWQELFHGWRSLNYPEKLSIPPGSLALQNGNHTRRDAKICLGPSHVTTRNPHCLRPIEEKAKLLLSLSRTNPCNSLCCPYFKNEKKSVWGWKNVFNYKNPELRHLSLPVPVTFYPPSP